MFRYLQLLTIIFFQFYFIISHSKISLGSFEIHFQVFKLHQHKENSQKKKQKKNLTFNNFFLPYFWMNLNAAKMKGSTVQFLSNDI